MLARRTCARAVAIARAPRRWAPPSPRRCGCCGCARSHFAPTPGMLGIFLLALVTTVFYGVFFWAIYLALEPFVRRHWPQTLVSWTTMLAGASATRRRPGRVVRRALGVLIALLVRIGTNLTGERGAAATAPAGREIAGSLSAHAV